MKSVFIGFLCILGPLTIGVALADETSRVASTLPGNPDEVLSMYADEPAMRRAIRKARDELTDFLELAESPKSHQKDFRVRVALIEGNRGEYIWIARFTQDDNSLFTGYVDDDIQMQTRFKRGDRFTFVRGDIGDWTYTDTRKKRVFGAYTECAIMTLAPADIAAKYRKERRPDCEF
jgi:uncharacterized protein YegJ (DUF2314 family)